MSSDGILLGFSKLIRKFNTAEEYTEVDKMFRRVYYLGQIYSLEVFLPGHALGTFPLLQWKRYQ